MNASPLIAPAPVAEPSEIDLEAGPGEQIQCRICLESDGRDFIAPCKCKGTSKYVHRECLDHWRAVKEGFAFAHCTTCKAPYHLRVHVIADRKWRTLKFRFFVTRDIIFIFLAVQLVIASLAYLVYLIDGFQQFWLRLAWGFDSELSFYYISGALLFFALLGLSGCFITCYDRRVRNDLAQPCRELCLFSLADQEMCFPDIFYVYAQTVIYQAHFVCGLTVPRAGVAVQVWQEYVVEDVDGEMTGSDWSPPPLPPEHIQQLKTLGLL
ncbi:RING/FYVE/PHD zinc finger superfamily protein [Prunus dulcis]|uniref:RING/FYVE/PHD zinc finger superfamily protein n=1 Tax=Prunus dulcis TaxID=3755 RepID=A0A4Y1RMN0_PRUDU|nr:RING/FYVE/PHD zinc finger superfamily protein [Prunus dulcis]